jgi:site-specific DNA-methyltransferase (adenine-specific)
MGKAWDSKGISFQKETWELIRNSCRSGAPLLSFGGTRTFHRIACAIEDAGWEIRDTLMWVYGQGFPKSLDISKAIDYDACREQLAETLGRKPTKDELKEAWEQFRVDVSVLPSSRAKPSDSGFMMAEKLTSSPNTPEAQLWEGYGTALKPAYEPIILAMNPLDGTFANNALKHGVAGLNIDQCRVGTEERYNAFAGNKDTGFTSADIRTDAGKGLYAGKKDGGHTVKGRFPANLIHDGSQMVLELFPESKSTGGRSGHTAAYSGGYKREYYGDTKPGFGDNGSAARFFYTAKASFGEREKGLKGFLPCVKCGGIDTDTHIDDKGNEVRCRRNGHPTVKVIALMEYLVKLVKMPEYNLILDPFMGSGTTLLACIRLGIPCIGIDNDEKACEIAARRCSQEVMELI